MAPLIFPFNFSLQQLDSIHVRDISSEDMDFFGQVSLQIPVLQVLINGFSFSVLIFYNEIVYNKWSDVNRSTKMVH